MQNEPLITSGFITAGVTAVLALLVAFGVDLTEAQNTAILGAAAFLAPLVVVWASRSRVTPNAKIPAPPAE